MSEESLRPLVVLHVPHGHETDPQALHAFERYVAEQYGGGVLVNPRLNAPAAAEGRAPEPILLGHWDRHLPGAVTADLTERARRIFFNLDWVGLKDAR